MQHPIQHIYQIHNDKGLLYAWFSSMHTRVDIVLSCRKQEEELMAVVNHIYDTLQQLENTANYYHPTSELAHVNRTAATTPVVISRPLYDIIACCLEYNKKTLGCFDITVHSDNYNQDTIHSVCLSPDTSSIFFSQKGTTINLSGFLKGYALDKIRELLTNDAIENALINMGNSSVLALGNHPVGKGWKISFENKANADDSTGQQEILLQDECLTTSGNDSPQRKHIISPQSGTLMEGLRQVAVVTTYGSIGEILSTALFVANREQREKIIATLSPKRIIDL